MPTRKATLAPIVLASLGIALIIADEASFRIELEKPATCPEGLACDRILVRDGLPILAGILMMISGGIIFVAERVMRAAKTVPSPDS